MSTVLTASTLGPRRLNPEEARGLAALDAAPEFPFRGEQQVLVKRVGENSTHLPPPVMMERTAVLDAATNILCCSCAMCFSAAPSSEKFHGSMNLAYKHGPVAAIFPSIVAAIQRCTA
jgi:hypothetical protein